MTPNGLHVSRVATVNWEGNVADTDAKIGPILWPRSGVGLHARVRRQPMHLLLGLRVCFTNTFPNLLS